MFVQNFNNNIIIVNNNAQQSVINPLETAVSLQPQLVSLHAMPQSQPYFNYASLADSNEQQMDGQTLLVGRMAMEENFASSQCTSDASSENYDPASYRADKLRPDHVECLCKVLENTRNISRLASFLSNFSTDLLDHPCREQLLRAKAVVLFHEQKFEDFYGLVQSHHFSPSNHPFLQKLWNEAHYTETEMMRGKKLDPVSRYRVRRKNAFPRTIWDGEGTSYCFKKSSRSTLKEAYRKHQTPSQHQKLELAKATGLSVIQVSNWFKNQRQRARQHRRQFRGCRSSSSLNSSDGADSEGDEEDFHLDTQFSTTEELKGDPKKKFKAGRKRGQSADGCPTFCPAASEVDTDLSSGATAAYSAAAAQLRMYCYTGQPTSHQTFFYPQQHTSNHPQPSIQLAMNLFNPVHSNDNSIFGIQNATNEFPLKYQCL